MGEGKRAIVLKYNSDLEGYKGVQRFRFVTGLQCFKQTFLIEVCRPHAEDGVTTKMLDKMANNGGGEGEECPKLDFNCLNGQCPVANMEIDIYERANEHLKIGFTVLKQNLRRINSID